MKEELTQNLLELIRRTSAYLPPDVEESITAWSKLEAKDSMADFAMGMMLQNTGLAKKRSMPACQDTGTITFYIHHLFNDPGEKGVGSSSLLWVLILAAGNWAGLSMHWLAKLVGVTCLAAVGIGLYHLLRPILSLWVALAVSLLVIRSGNMLWFALSGMETMLFLALGILALLSYREQRWAWLGIALGLMIITRLEGIILVFVIAGFDIWRHKAVRSEMLFAVQ